MSIARGVMQLGSRPGSVAHCPMTWRKASHFYFCFGKTRGWVAPVLTWGQSPGWVPRLLLFKAPITPSPDHSKSCLHQKSRQVNRMIPRRWGDALTACLQHPNLRAPPTGWHHLQGRVPAGGDGYTPLDLGARQVLGWRRRGDPGGVAL